MGLIRKSLMLGTGGIVSGNSKKQRVAKSQLRELRTQTQLLEQIADPGKLERERAARQAAKGARQARREARRGPNVVFVEKPRPARKPASPGAIKALRVVGWVWVAFLALVAFSVATVSIPAAAISAVLASGLIWILVRKTSPRTAAMVPASQAPTR